jgi:hypothetical protein
MKFFKVLSSNNNCCYGGDDRLTWSLPVQKANGSWIPGEWMPPVKGALNPHVNGYHLVQEDALILWLNTSIYLAEPLEGFIETKEMIVCRSVRLLQKTPWDERTARLFACDCAERVLPLYEKEHPNDTHPRRTIEVARAFAEGKATEKELAAVCNVADFSKFALARIVAWSEANIAAQEVASLSAEIVANNAQENEMDSSKEKVVYDKAWDAEQAWQTKRLMHYLNMPAKELER